MTIYFILGNLNTSAGIALTICGQQKMAQKSIKTTVDGLNPAPHGMYKNPVCNGINYIPINWCRISSINSMGRSGCKKNAAFACLFRSFFAGRRQRSFTSCARGTGVTATHRVISSFLAKGNTHRPHRIHGTGIFTYAFTIQIS